MSPTLQDEIKQSKPFASPREELWLNLSRTAAIVSHQMEQAMRRHGISPAQYNVLRILRGAGPAGICQNNIGERLVAAVPDVPRILERMEKAGWVLRTRATQDRRMVMTSLTASGLDLVDSLDEPIGTIMESLFDGMPEEEIHQLSTLLEAARQPRA